MTDEQMMKHLDIIQSAVGRLAGNSFLVKGWSITLISALLALSAKDANAHYAGLAFLPAFCFWGLDAYYLSQEQLFRGLYDAVRSGSPKIELFSMKASVVSAQVDSWRKTLLSRTVFGLHGPIVLAVVAVTVRSYTRQ